LKGTAASLTIFFVAILLLVTPSYQITTISQLSTTSYQGRTVYNLSSPITLQPQPSNMQTPSPSAYWISNSFFLTAGSTVAVTFVCPGASSACLVVIWQNWGNQQDINFMLNGKPTDNPGSGLTVPQSGPYEATILNIAASPVTISLFSIVEQMPSS
jgi:hypothetical protein